MSTSHEPTAASGGDDPLHQFSDCHAGILNQLHALAGLPALARAAAQARETAAHTLSFFRDVVHEHHAQEEKELFPAVLASAQPGDERVQVRQIVERLTREHRDIEAGWARLEPALRDVARGRDAELDAAAVAALVQHYEAHAGYEERVFLPLSQTILGRDDRHKAALGLALHMRHALPEVLARYGRRL